MDETRLKRLGAELAKARKRRDEWEAKVKDLERRYKEAENTCIHDMVHAANLSPEQLAELIRAAAAGQPYTLPADAVPAVMQDDSDDYLDDIDEENQELKSMVEAYKTRAPQTRDQKAAEPRESAREKLDALVKDTASKLTPEKTPKAKSKTKKGPEL